jgi:hypothetical protein
MITILVDFYQFSANELINIFFINSSILIYIGQFLLQYFQIIFKKSQHWPRESLISTINVIKVLIFIDIKVSFTIVANKSIYN